jgi:hypothetical protein
LIVKTTLNTVAKNILHLNLQLNKNVMKQKKLQNLLLALASVMSFSAHAQKTSSRIELTKGQKLQVDNTLNSVATMEMMGQSMEINSDASMLHQVEVKDKRDTSYTIASTLTRITTTGSMMGQTYSFDSDNKQDTSELAKMMKKQLNVPMEMELKNDGKLLNQNKTDAPAQEDANPMMGMINTMTGSGNDFNNTVTEMFLALPSGVKQGDTWSDSLIGDGVKTYRTYTIKEISNNIAAVTLTGKQTTNKKIEQMGSEVNVSLEAKLSGESKVDVNTGMVQQKNLTVEGSGNADAMGQSIPLTMKVTSVTTVKNL